MGRQLLEAPAQSQGLHVCLCLHNVGVQVLCVDVCSMCVCARPLYASMYECIVLVSACMFVSMSVQCAYTQVGSCVCVSMHVLGGVRVYI